MPMNYGNFAWYDLMTSDTQAAAAFYRNVIGWEARSSGVAGDPYQLLSMAETDVGGLMAIPDDAAGMPACWNGYILVDDVDRTVERLKAAGGVLHKGPVDVPGMVRFAVVADPQGAGFLVFKGLSEAPPARLAPGAPGTIGWHELHAADGASAFKFYADLFGWTKADAMDMGAQGVYQLFCTGDAPVGGMMTRMPDTPAPFWLYYINVDAIDAAVARTTEGGGKVLMGPHQVPGGSWIVQCFDPQGALFAMVAPKR